MARHILPGFAFTLAISTMAFSAAAQIQQRPSPAHQPSSESTQTRSAEPIVSDVDGASYGVRFDDELLSAIAEDGTIPRIIVRPVKGFGQLNRPRVSFVRELAKSVETI